MMYSSLDPSKAEFRLLRLLETEEGEITCGLQIHSLNDVHVPPWKALSYRWGDEEPSHTIQVDGQPILIRSNLHSFLKQMLSEQRHNWFFVDALCINQSHPTEQAYQVTLMRDIYRGAEEVYAWIVPEPRCYVETNPFLPKKIREIRLDLSSPEKAVVHNSFWSRTWVIQEVLLAKRLSIRVGSSEVEWLDLIPESGFLKPRRLPSKNESLEKVRRVFRQVLAVRTDKFQMHGGMSDQVYETLAIQTLSWRRFHYRALRAGHHLPFHKAVDFFALQSCSRLHDKIYGILGLTNSRIKVDYSTSVTEVFMNTLADYLLSLGFITDTIKSMWTLRAWGITASQGMIAPFFALGLDPFHPVVYLVTQEIADFFAPSKGQRFCEIACMSSWQAKHNGPEALQKVIGDDPRFEVGYIGSTCVRFVKHIRDFSREYNAQLQATRAILRSCKESDTVLAAPGEDGEVRKYSEWVASARATAEDIWQRFQESGKDAEGDLDDEEWTLIG